MNPTDAFWQTMRQFRDDTLAVQLVLLCGYGFALYRIAWKPGRATDAWVKGILAVAFFWNGFACFLHYFWASLIARFLAGPLFLVIGFLLLVDMVAGQKIHFTFALSPARRAASFFFILLAFLFPVLGLLTGHGMIALPTAPCPLAGFTLALLAAAVPRVDGTIYALVLIWAFVNIPKVFGFMDCYEEVTLVLTGFYALMTFKTIRPSGVAVVRP